MNPKVSHLVLVVKVVKADSDADFNAVIVIVVVAVACVQCCSFFAAAAAVPVVAEHKTKNSQNVRLFACRSFSVCPFFAFFSCCSSSIRR